MKITVKVKAGAKEESVEKISDTVYNVRVKAPAHEGKANQAVRELLAKYFDISQSMVTIKKGFLNKNKIIEIIQ